MSKQQQKKNKNPQKKFCYKKEKRNQEKYRQILWRKKPSTLPSLPPSPHPVPQESATHLYVKPIRQSPDWLVSSYRCFFVCVCVCLGDFNIFQRTLQNNNNNNNNNKKGN